MAAQHKPVPAGDAGAFTLLKSAGKLRLTKLWKASGEIEGYDDARNYRIQTVSVEGFTCMSDLLFRIEGKSDIGTIHGEFIGDEAAQLVLPPEMPGHYRRVKELFRDVPKHALPIDVDGFRPVLADPVLEPVAAIDEYILECLPEEFQGVSYHWQLSSSAGKPGSEGVLKAHIWFWLTEPRTCAELTHWARVLGLNVDKTVYRTVQFRYTASPVFEDGVADPVPVRSGRVDGWMGETVDLVVPEGAVLSLVAGSGQAKAYPDARAKPGLIGAFNRAYTMDEVWDEFLPGQFERVAGSDRRVTWHGGGGAAEGCFVDDSGEWLVNTHDSSPHEDRAVCKWDIVRVYLFGDRDSKEVLEDNFDVTMLPSHRAMVELASGLDRVQEELDAGKQQAAEAAVEANADWAQQLDAAADETTVRALCAQIETDAALDRVARELLAHRVKDAMRRATGAAFPIAVARGMVGIGRRMVGGGGGGGMLVLPDISPQGAPQETEENLAAICDHEGIIIRYNVISKEDEILIPGESFSMDNRIAASITSLRSRCHRADMKTGHLKKFVTLAADRNLYNPVAEWIDSRPWDGVCRIESFFNTIVEDPTKIKKQLKHLLMTRWAMSAIEAAFSPTGVMARGVLTLQGVQYAGKTRWVLSLAPEALGVIKIGRHVNPHDKDSMDQILSSWIAELGEVDATFRKSDIAALKAWLTNNMDEFRRAYAEAKSQFARRTVFVASVNELKYLVDPTGNTRFWTIPTLAVVHDHGLDMQQVWAELKVLWQGGEKHYLSVSEMEMLVETNEVFEVADPMGEMLASHLDWDSATRQWMQVSDVLRWLGIKNPTRAEATSAGRALNKLNGGQHRKTNGRQLCLVPTSKKGYASGTSDDDFDGSPTLPIPSIDEAFLQ